jgi:chromate transporter
MSARPGLTDVLVEWGRIGCLGFGGPPTHISMLRELCVERRGWLSATEFEDGVAVCNLLPGPASTQLAIFCAHRVAGRRGALVGGVAFIVPGLIVILALAGVFLASSPPTWVRAAGAGSGAAVAAVAVNAGIALLPSSWQGFARPRWRWIVYGILGGIAAATVGPYLVLVLLGCGLLETSFRRTASFRSRSVTPAWLALLGATTGGALALAWVALKVGALSYGGGFVIVPLMHHDAVNTYRWMTDGQFLDAVALGQITPGPVVLTVAAVGYAAAGVGGGLLAAGVAFAPSFLFVIAGASRFDALRQNQDVRSFLNGAGPAAIGAILGSAIPLATSLAEPWQYGILAGAAMLLLALRRSVVTSLLLAAAAGVVAVQLGAALP